MVYYWVIVLGNCGFVVFFSGLKVIFFYCNVDYILNGIWLCLGFIV